MTKRDFLSMEAWGRDGVERLLAEAARLKQAGTRGGLEGKVCALVFMDPSLRTRASMETAMFLHGGHAVILEPGKTSWTLETRPGVVMDGGTTEHIIEAARVLGRYADAVGIRVFPRGDQWAEARLDPILHDFARYCEKPVINLESTRRHPCQGLADALTLREHLGDTKGKRCVVQWTWHPKQLPTAVPASGAIAAAMMGMEVVIARPEGWALDPDDTATIRALCAEHGQQLIETDDPAAALDGADAVYVKAWGSVGLFGRPEEEAKAKAHLRDWRYTPAWQARTRGGAAKVLHCLPVRRNVEIDDAVLDGPHAVVIDEAENRLHVQRALLLDLIGGRTA
ncbi:MAG: N-acetylornithine carbamoyltransferase [Gemmatimonadales bacterium]|nr:N-acetylornithine carbamoyltransferase [Gemmatimonadales bacterium]